MKITENKTESLSELKKIADRTSLDNNEKINTLVKNNSQCKGIQIGMEKSLFQSNLKKNKENSVVEYEREVRDEKKKENDRSHLTNKTFIDAMALLSEDKK